MEMCGISMWDREAGAELTVWRWRNRRLMHKSPYTPHAYRHRLGFWEHHHADKKLCPTQQYLALAGPLLSGAADRLRRAAARTTPCATADPRADTATVSACAARGGLARPGVDLRSPHA